MILNPAVDSLIFQSILRLSAMTRKDFVRRFTFLFLVSPLQAGFHLAQPLDLG